MGDARVIPLRVEPPAPGGRDRPADGGAAYRRPRSERVLPGRARPGGGRPAGARWERTAGAALAFARRRMTGDYEVDEFGFDRDLTEGVFAPLLRPLYSRWFRVEVAGLQNVPEAGAALIVANHSGTLPVDSLMTQLALLDHHPAHRHLRMLGADLVFRLPVIGELARKAGHTLACGP